MKVVLSVIAGLLLLFVITTKGSFAQKGGSKSSQPLSIDYADSRYVASWLQHSVLGGPSFDAFERLPGNPIWRGSPPLEWPVNVFLFKDPIGGKLYAYIGAYPRGYIRGSTSSKCIGLRSGDGGRTWDSLGVMLDPSPAQFDKNGHTPDVSVTYEAGRYHMVYDWGEIDFNKEGGLGYAWADKPEGPWHRAPEPITRNTQLPLMNGRYRRTYAATLIRRANDWLITGMMDDAPYSWALFVMTAQHPEGPYTERKLVRQVRDGYVHPPLMEFYPSFVYKDTLYAPATSVARNRNVNALFCAPLQEASNPSAWQMMQFGSLWHADDVPSEYEGLWGQTFSGQVDSAGNLVALFPSRDALNQGTINVAQRSWLKPFHPKGFVVNAHGGPSMTLLRKAWSNFTLDVKLSIRGTARLIWNYKALLGPDSPSSDATIDVGTNRNYKALELTDTTWHVVAYDHKGLRRVLANGKTTISEKEQSWRIENRNTGFLRIAMDGATIWEGTDANSNSTEPCPIGWWVEPRSHLTVKQFEVNGTATPARFYLNATDALLGAGENSSQWVVEHEGFRSLQGYVSQRPEAQAKWNTVGQQFVLWSPKGPGYGEADIYVDGVFHSSVNLNHKRSFPSRPVWKSRQLPDGYHAILLKARHGSVPVDCLEVYQ